MFHKWMPQYPLLGKVIIFILRDRNQEYMKIKFRYCFVDIEYFSVTPTRPRKTIMNIFSTLLKYINTTAKIGDPILCFSYICFIYINPPRYIYIYRALLTIFCKSLETQPKIYICFLLFFLSLEKYCILLLWEKNLRDKKCVFTKVVENLVFKRKAFF